MQFLLLMTTRKDDPDPPPVEIAEMGKFARDLAEQGVLVQSAPLHPEAAGARVRVVGGRAHVVDGPFAESKEVVAGYFLVEAPSRAAAIEIASRCPFARARTVEVRQAESDRAATPPPPSKRWMLLLMDDARSAAADPEAQGREMTKYLESLAREGRYVECAGLPRDVPAARVEVRGGKARVSDGPFAESKEVVGGYVVVAAPTKADAIELARRCPSAEWYRVEVREVVPVPVS